MTEGARDTCTWVCVPTRARFHHSVFQRTVEVCALSIDDVTVTEGHSGTVDAIFTVSLSAASGQVVTVDFATANGTALAGSDYVAGAGALTFIAGDTEETITIEVSGDLLDELDETFLVNLSNPGNATISDGQGQGRIRNDDPDEIFADGFETGDATAW